MLLENKIAVVTDVLNGINEQIVDVFLENETEIRVNDSKYVSGNLTVMNMAHIGDESVVSVGAVIAKSIPEKIVVKGNPAR